MYAEEAEMIKALKDDALKAIQAARIALIQYRPFYGTLLSSMPLIADWRWCSTAATDHRNIYYNPEFIMGMPPERKKKVFERIDGRTDWSPERKKYEKEFVEVFYRKKTPREVVFIFAHETRHITNDHMSRGKAFDGKLFNVAADEYINTDLVVSEFGPGKSKMGWFPHGKQTVFNKNAEFGFLEYCYCNFKFHGMTSEQIYSYMAKNGKADKKSLDVHMGDYDPERDILGYTDPQPTFSPIEEEESFIWSAGLIDAALKACGGEGPKEARELVARFSKPHINYLDIIKQKMISRIKSHLSYRRTSRRSGSVTHAMRQFGALSNRQSIVLPGRKKANTIDIVIGFDVSGSISQTTLTRIFNEIIGLCTLYPTFRVTLFCWSTKVGDVMVYTQDNLKDMLNYKVSSTGGTWASCAFEYIDEHIPKAEQLIMFTDGYIEDLNNKKGQEWGRKYDTLWVICGGRPDWKAPFGRAVDLDEHSK